MRPAAELLAKVGDDDVLRSVAEAVVQLLMEANAEGLIGAGRHERSGERTAYRNGYHDRTLPTGLGSLQLRIPMLRQGSCPTAWCRSGFPEQGWLPGQFASTGMLTMASSLSGAMVSSVM